MRWVFRALRRFRSHFETELTSHFTSRWTAFVPLAPRASVSTKLGRESLDFAVALVVARLQSKLMIGLICTGERILFGLAKGAAIAMFVYYFCRAFLLVHGKHWSLIHGFRGARGTLSRSSGSCSCRASSTPTACGTGACV